MRTLVLVLVVLSLAPLQVAGAQDRAPRDMLALGPALRVAPVPSPEPPRPRVIVGPPTPAMRVWVLRGAGPAHSRILGPLEIDAAGDADTAIDRLQERALALHADAVIRVRIDHGPGGEVRVRGIAVRFGSHL